MSRVFIVLVSLKCTCITLLLHVLLNLSHRSCMYGTTLEMFLLVVLLLVPLLLLLLLGWLSLEPVPLLVLCLQSVSFYSLLSVHGGKWQACKAFLICSNSLFSVYWLVDTTLALCANVFKALCLAPMKWLLSQCKY